MIWEHTKTRHFCIISAVEAPKINREHHHDKSVPEKSTKIDDESQLNVHKQLIDELKYDDTSESWHGTIESRCVRVFDVELIFTSVW